MEQNPQKPGPVQATFHYIDRPELAETFADSITAMFFDGQSLRMEFGVSRVGEIKPDVPITGRRYPVCRLVLTPAAAFELINRAQQIESALTQAGVIKPAQAASKPAPTAKPAN
jgi:hypothetical protein